MKEAECPFCASKGFSSAVFNKSVGREVRTGAYLCADGKLRETQLHLEPVDADEVERWRRNRIKPMSLVPVYEIARGKYKLIELSGQQLIQPLEKFKLQLIGVDLVEKPPVPPPFSFFTVMPLDWIDNKPTRWRIYYACRITREASSVEVLAHWWPSHGLLTSIQGFYPAPNSNEGLDKVMNALEFFQVETRGAPKIVEADLIKALKKQGQNATQKSIAKALQTSDRTLRDWLSRKGKSWQEIKTESTNAQI